MGDLIVMTRANRPKPVVTGASADILFFTGVRYYRMPEEASPAAMPSDVGTPLRRRSEKAKKIALARRLKRQG